MERVLEACGHLSPSSIVYQFHKWVDWIREAGLTENGPRLLFIERRRIKCPLIYIVIRWYELF